MIKLLSLFSGIGAFETALHRGGYQFEIVNYCEIDPYASKAYSQIHGISNTQLYKMAGNSIVVNVLEAIFRQLFKENHK